MVFSSCQIEQLRELVVLKNKTMKKIIPLLICLISFSSFSQGREEAKIDKIKLTDTRWKSSRHCFTSEDIDTYNLYPTIDTIGHFDWGNFISFTDKAFSTDYSAPCGNDCFTSVTGTYKFVGFNRIEVYVETINRSGFCSTKSETPKKVFGIYLIEKTPTGLQIRKSQK